MIVMVFLRLISNLALMFIFGCPIVVHYGANVLQCIIALLLIAAGGCLSFVLRCKTEAGKKNKFLKYLPLILPAACFALQGTCAAFIIVFAICWGYCLFLTITDNFLPDPEHQKLIFKINLIEIGVLLLADLLVGAQDITFTMLIFGGLVGLCSSVILMRSLRHEPEVYDSLSYQLMNFAIIAAVAVVSFLLSSKTVLNGVWTGLKTVYTGIAYVFVNGIMYVIKGIGAVISWIASLFAGGTVQDAAEETTVQLDIDSASDLFGEQTGSVEFPQALKVILIVLAIMIAVALIVLLLKALAGRRVTVRDSAAKSDSVIKNDRTGKKPEQQSAQAQGVRKQYRKYMTFLREHGQTITADETTLDIKSGSQSALRGEDAEELRTLYIEARYNDKADKNDEERAKELVKNLKKAAQNI